MFIERNLLNNEVVGKLCGISGFIYEYRFLEYFYKVGEIVV